jgi:hypothetical protein
MVPGEYLMLSHNRFVDSKFAPLDSFDHPNIHGRCEHFHSTHVLPHFIQLHNDRHQDIWREFLQKEQATDIDDLDGLLHIYTEEFWPRYLNYLEEAQRRRTIRNAQKQQRQNEIQMKHLEKKLRQSFH